jgi:hypothetical protein
MPRVQVGYNPGAEALQTTASPNIQAVKAQYDPRSSSAYQLAEALGKQQPLLDKFNEDLKADKRRQEILDNMKVPAFIERARTEQGTGVIDGVQAGTVAPGASEVVNARTNDGLGAEWGRKNVQSLIDAVNADATLIQDPAKRAQFIAQKRRELVDQLPKGNDFFTSGALGALDKEINSFENKWQAKSSAYAVEVQTKDFTGKVVEALASSNPDEALLKLDQTWKMSSALDNNARNDLVVKTITQQAYGDRNAAILDRIPQRFLNAETKAKITQVRSQIQELKLSDYRAVKTLEADQREAALRSGKTDIVKRVAAGQTFDPAEFRDNPELYQFAVTMREAPRLPAAQRTANLQRVRLEILSQATVEGVDVNKLMDAALKNPKLNPSDRDKLATEMPRLVEGMVAMNDETVKSAYTTRIGASLDEASKNPLIVLSPTLRSRTVNLFDQQVRQGFNAFYEEKGTWPTGAFKTKIVDEAVKATEAFMAGQLQVNGRGGASPGGPRNEASGEVTRPAAAPVQIKNAADYNALPSGATYTTPEGVTKRKP